MLQIKYADNMISSQGVYVIKTDKDDISLVGNIPVYASVLVKIFTDNHTITVPLEFAKIEDDLSIYRTKIYLTDYDITNLVNSNSIYLRLYINHTVIPGKIDLQAHSGSIARLKMNNESVLTPIAKELSSLKSRLDTYMARNYSFEKTNETKKGMVPVAVDNFGNYIWDYPFNSTEQSVKELSVLVANMSTQINSLVAKVNELEQKVFEHINESYYI